METSCNNLFTSDLPNVWNKIDIRCKKERTQSQRSSSLICSNIAIHGRMTDIKIHEMVESKNIIKKLTS